MPRKLNGLSLVETSEGIFAIGGMDSDQNPRKEILKLSCSGDKIETCKWIEQDQELEIARGGHVAIPLPTSFSCPAEVKMSSVSIVMIVLFVLIALAIVGFVAYKKYPAIMQFIQSQ